MLDTDKQQLLDLIASGDSVRQAVSSLGLAASSVYAERDRCTQFKADMIEAQEVGKPMRLKRSAAKRELGRKARAKAAKEAEPKPQPFVASQEMIALHDAFLANLAIIMPTPIPRSAATWVALTVRNWHSQKPFDPDSKVDIEQLRAASSRCAAEFIEFLKNPKPLPFDPLRLPFDIMLDLVEFGKHSVDGRTRFGEYFFKLKNMVDAQRKAQDIRQQAPTPETKVEIALAKWSGGGEWSDLWLNEEALRKLSPKAADSFVSWHAKQE